MTLLPFVLVPLCALLNHLGGQSASVPDPRFTCRMLGQGLAFGAVALASGVPVPLAALCTAAAVAGFSFWAVWKWGPGFMAITGVDSRGTDLASRATALLYHPTGALSPAQCKTWGFVYMTLRGAYLYPLFGALAYLLTPWAAAVGVACLLQGLVYRLSAEVLYAEYAMGAGPIGCALAVVLEVYLITK